MALVAMTLTSAVANSAAAAACAGKKGGQVQLQAELNSEDEWRQFLERDGLLVVDVYTEWCGPCTGMVGILKKIKVELGGDNLHLAVAKADTIDCLQRFRNRSEPTWMFLAAGQLLDVVFGADVPRIARTIEEELKNEALAKNGERERPRRAPHELTPPEQETADALARQMAARREREAAAVADARRARREARALRLEAHFADVCPALLLPHAQKHLRKVTDALEPYGIVIADKCPVVVGKEVSRALAMEDPQLATNEAAGALAERPSLTLLLKKLPDKEGDVVELSRRALFGDGIELHEDEAPKQYLNEELKASGVPGLFVPADRHQRAAALDLLFPKAVSVVASPPKPSSPPHVAVMLGAWQRCAALAAASTDGRLLCYGFFADAQLDEPKLICKTIEQYEDRSDKDFSEVIVLMLAVGVAEPALVEPQDIPGTELPEGLLSLGPLHVSEDTVVGAEECARFFPPGYTAPEHKPKPKSKKKKKKRHENKRDTQDENNTDTTNGTVDENDAEASADADGEGAADGEEEADREGEGEDAEEAVEEVRADKATSPPPVT